jgi:hypothetical protein
VLANQDDITISEPHLTNSFIVDVRSVETFHVLNHITVRSPINLGVMSRNSGIIDAKDVIRLTANSDYATRWDYFTQDTVLKLKK